MLHQLKADRRIMLLHRSSLIICLAVAFFAPTAATNADLYFQDFIRNIERLILNTTDQALLVTKKVYLNLNQTMPQTLRNASQNLLQRYIRQVDKAIGQNVTYAEKRKLLQQFRANNHRIEQLHRQLERQQPALQFHLISDDFYNGGQNRTEFDNLYMEFMREFDKQSQRLWQHLSEQTVEQKEELLEILDEISSERELREKDKLYDEFIEMFLFKKQMDDVENRESDMNIL